MWKCTLINLGWRTSYNEFAALIVLILYRDFCEERKWMTQGWYYTLMDYIPDGFCSRIIVRMSLKIWNCHPYSAKLNSDADKDFIYLAPRLYIEGPIPLPIICGGGFWGVHVWSNWKLNPFISSWTYSWFHALGSLELISDHL